MERISAQERGGALTPFAPASPAHTKPENFAVSGAPTAVLLSREGRVLQVWRGAPSKEMQDAMRAALLSI